MDSKMMKNKDQLKIRR